jgi:hypothetical protein
MLEDGAVDSTDRLADDIVDKTKVGSGVMQIIGRQGGNASNWAVSGVTDYTPTNVLVQVGASEWTGAAATSGQETITWPTAFSNTPIVVCNTGLVGTSDPKINIIPQTVGISNCIFTWRNVEDAVTRTSLKFMWMAIGPE